MATKIKASIFEKDIEVNYISLVQKMLFVKHLALMLRSGLAISDALKLLYASSRGKFKTIIGEVYTSVKSGASLSSALANYPHVFSGFLIGSIYAGEASGSLEANLENVSNELKKEKELLDKVRGALFYPALVLVAALSMGLFVAFYILPKVTPILSGLRMELPWSTRSLIFLSSFSQSYGLGILIVTIILGLMLIWSYRQTWSQQFVDRLWLRLPLIGPLIKHVNLSRFSLILAMLLKSGLTITEALDLTRVSMSNYQYRHILDDVKSGVDKGSKLSDNLQKYDKYFPEISVRMIRIGEESGKLEETLFYLTEFYESEVDNATKKLATAVEPFLLIGIGLFVLFLALAIITPIYSITGGVSR